MIQSENYEARTRGWKIHSDGSAEFNDGYFRGNLGVEGDIATIKGNITAINGNISTINGDISTVKGDISTVKGNITSINGNITTIYGDISTINGTMLARDGVFSGTLQAVTGDFSGSLSGNIMNGRHLYIHESHRITSPRTLGQLYTALRNIGVNPGTNNYINLLCAGNIQFADQNLLSFIPNYIKAVNSSEIYLYGSGYKDGDLYFGISHILTSNSTVAITSMELLVL